MNFHRFENEKERIFKSVELRELTTNDQSSNEWLIIIYYFFFAWNKHSVSLDNSEENYIDKFSLCFSDQ